ncbi:MAG: GTP-binding protein, partial [Alloscardovia omnicolens]|nr:GTP-binding protein [Alloscardovia omnicolens]
MTAHNQPGSTDQKLVRNFCIIAHIDHGKSTVADRILQLSGIVEQREMRDRFLDRMDIEQERGITIKSQAVRVPWTVDGVEYTLGMIDTPGHVDFSYEVSRSLAACEGAVLLVDATQGIEAQTLSNLYMAIDNDLAIIPVLNKIDLPSADPDKHADEIAGLLGIDSSEVLRVSGKTGDGVDELLNRIVSDIPAPTGEADAKPRALIFDSVYDSYRGIVTYIRMVDGELKSRQKIRMMGLGTV